MGDQRYYVVEVDAAGDTPGVLEELTYRYFDGDNGSLLFRDLSEVDEETRSSWITAILASVYYKP